MRENWRARRQLATEYPPHHGSAAAAVHSLEGWAHLPFAQNRLCFAGTWRVPWVQEVVRAPHLLDFPQSLRYAECNAYNQHVFVADFFFRK